MVQKGLRKPIEVFWAGEKGWGMRTKKKISKGTFLFEYVGEIVTNSELMRRRAISKLGKLEAFALALDADWKSKQVVNDDMALCIDSTFGGNVSRFLNHRYLLYIILCDFELHLMSSIVHFWGKCQ